MTAINARMNAAEWLLLLLLSLLWGGSFFFNAVALGGLPVLTVVAARVVLAAAILWGVLRLRREAVPRGTALWGAFAVMGLLNNALPFGLIVWGQSHIASGVAAILNASTPLFTVLLANAWTRDERMTPGKLAGVLIGMAGVAVMMGTEALRSLGVDVLAQAACLAAAVSYACAGIFGRRFRAMGVTPLATAAGQASAASLLLLPIALLTDRPWALPLPGREAVAAVIALASISTALAYIVYFRLLATVGATNIVLVTFLAPVSAILLGVGILGEVLLPKHLAGMVLIGVGLAAIDGRLVRRP